MFIPENDKSTPPTELGSDVFIVPIIKGSLFFILLMIDVCDKASNVER